MEIQSGVEGIIEWKVDSSRYDPIVVSAKNLVNGKTMTEIYPCKHNPVFGYDIEDVAEIDKILEKMIKELNE